MLQSKTYYSYDERGNLSGEQTRTYASEGLAGSTAEQAGLSNDANSVKTYHYDRFNRLVEYTDGDTVAKYEYNADNLRTAKTVNGRRTDYVWDGTNLRYETGGNGTHTYAYDPTGVHMMDGNYYVKDGHGNVTGMYDANAEFVSDTYYDAFGNIAYGDTPDPFGYSGEYHDSETGLIYLRNRYYDSSTGRFITEDPAKDCVNWYSYCAGDPVNMVDPWGLTFVTGGTFVSDDVEYTVSENTTINTDYIDRDQYVSINETSTNISVYAFVEFSGTHVNAWQAIPPYNRQKTYKDSFIIGVESAWSGEYNGKSVSTTVIEVNNLGTEQKQNSINVKISRSDKAPETHIAVDMSYADIDMSIVNPVAGLSYNDLDFELTSAHEFGHVLGMNDVYGDNSIVKFPSIMNNQWITRKANPIEFAMMMKAYQTREYQRWNDNIELLNEMGVEYTYE